MINAEHIIKNYEQEFDLPTYKIQYYQYNHENKFQNHHFYPFSTPISGKLHNKPKFRNG